MAMKNLPTLKGVFPQPKAPPKRDFLRENKLKLKDLQKHNNKKQDQNENDNSGKRLQRHRSVTRTSSVNRRINSGCSCSSKKTQSSVNSTKQVSTSQHCDKGIQTDEINDETFLSNALKRCFSNNDVNFKQNSDIDYVDKCPSTECIHQEYNSAQSLGNQQKERREENYIPDTPTLDIDLNNFISEEDRLPTVQSDQQEQIKKRQQRVIGPPELGSRSDLKLPKYLEKEKRERELQRIKEMERDPHCPKDHYVLDDKERREALKTAEKRFQELVNELNRMPMSSETLRIRNRKMEIEKALIELENSIRTFSKSKVYVKCEN